MENTSEDDEKHASEDDDSSPSEQTISLVQEIPHKLTPDLALQIVGEFGLFQRMLYFLLWLPAGAMAVGVYVSVFMEFTPLFHCSQNSSQTFSPSMMNHTCSPRSSPLTSCTSWTFDPSVFSSTVVTEWGLVCTSSHLRTVSTTVYMSGMLVGSFFFGWFGDRFGRRTTFAATTLALAGGSLAAGLAPSFPLYMVARFITSCGGVGLFITSFVLALEFVGTKYRTVCGVAIEIPFALGELYIVLMAYLIRDWRTYQLVIGLPFFLFLLYLFKIPESVRWQLSKGHVSQAKTTVERIAHFNGRPIPDYFPSLSAETAEKMEKEDVGLTSLLLQPTMRRRLGVMGLNWAATTLAYYGLSLNSAGLGSDPSDPFSNFALSAAMEIPSYIFCILCLDRFGRKSILAFSQILAGTTCILAGCISPDMELFRLILSLAGKFGASAGFAVVFVFTAELFPTPVRNSALGLCSTLARLGGILAPSVASLATVDPRLPFSVMGSSCCLAGLVVYLLPETAGQPLPDTLEEAQELGGRRGEK